MHRCETITSEEGEKKEEVEHLREALRVCGYPSWALNKGTYSCKKKKNKKKTNDRNYRSQVVIPYVEGVSERVQRVLKKYGVATSMRPHTTLSTKNTTGGTQKGCRQHEKREIHKEREKKIDVYHQ